MFSAVFFAEGTELLTSSNQEQKTEEREEDAGQSAILGEKFKKVTSMRDFFEAADITMHFEPSVYINPYTEIGGKFVSAPSPIIYPISIGFLWPNYTFLAVNPVISFFMMNHLWYENIALPAEIENRTTTTLSFMLDIPASMSLYFEKSRLQMTAGLGILMRFGILAPSVSSTDYGYSGSAGSDVDNINDWFLHNMNWFYITTGISWQYQLASKLRAGPVLNIYIPIGTIISTGTAQGMMISFGIKICR